MKQNLADEIQQFMLTHNLDKTAEQHLIYWRKALRNKLHSPILPARLHKVARKELERAKDTRP